MKSGNRPAAVVATVVLCIAGSMAGRAQMEEWLQHLPVGTVLGIFFRTVSMPGGEISYRRPPAETRPALGVVIHANPRDISLYRMRAYEAELAEDYTAAEADWKRYAELSADSAAGYLALSDFYHRRLRPREEIAALLVVTHEKSDLITAVEQQRPWRAFERMMTVVEDSGLSQTDALRILRAWVARYPRQTAPYERLISNLSTHREYAAAEAEIAAYARVFHDDLYPIRARADLEVSRGNVDAAIRIYDAAFQPLWPDDMTKSWFQLLDQEHRLREFVGRTRSAIEANPADLNATARLFDYFRSQNNVAAAQRALVEYRVAKESGKYPWTADELLTTARLFEQLPDVSAAARLWYALYSVPGADNAHEENALYGLANLLLTEADQPIRFGSGDLSFYKDIGTMDDSPGFLNGILSLILNGRRPRWAYQQQNGKAAPYFHRAAASQFTALLEQRFPQSAYRDPLRAGLVGAYATYGDDAAVIEAGRAYLTAFPRGGHRFSTGTLVADALARQNRVREEFALYDQFLRELAGRARGVPIGSARQPSQQPNETVGARSPEYVQVLDRYLSALAALRRPMDALRVYRTEIDRNPNDPGLYERLAAFLEQNDMTAEVVQTYRHAIAKFPDRSWYHKLARWYLRRRQSEEVEKISKEAVRVFSGTELESYFSEIVSGTEPQLYLQLNLYALGRFPEDLVFVHNLINAYSRPETADPKRAEELYRSYWFYDDTLRTAFFRNLAANGRLYPELEAIRKANSRAIAGQTDPQSPTNFAAAQFAAEAEIWLSHFEAAAPPMKLLADASPGQRAYTDRASSLYRSLAAYFPADTEIAVHLADNEYRSAPRDRALLARIGDIYADREQFARARLFWNRMPQTEAGRPEAWLDAATVFWDYYLFDDAFRLIGNARKRFDNAALFAYQAGAINENKREYASAVQEYVAGALAGDEQCTSRLSRLAIRAQTRELVDKATAAAAQGSASWAALSLRISILERQQRRQDLQTLIASQITAQKSQTTMEQLAAIAQSQGFDALQVQAISREIELTNDPVEKMKLTLDLVHLDESRKDVVSGGRTADALWREHPEILGVIRAAVDFHVRNKQAADAVSILLDSAKRARSDLAADFTFEAARIATSAGNFDQARDLLSGLLAATPYRADYLTAMAETYLQAHDDQHYHDFEVATIEALKKSPLAPAEKIDRIASIRRSLIPALTRMNDFASAVDQYIEVINRYSEDQDLTREAASYAAAHGHSAKLVAFYRKTISDAPRDYRWPIVIARIETVMENYPAAIADYDLAMKDRPDRSDIVEARANLEERLLRFEDAERSYLRLYELSYHAPEWLEKAAEVRARLGRRAEAVDALKTAIIGAHTETAEADFDIAARLESWHLMDEATAFAERGAKLAGVELFTERWSAQAQVYARILAETRRYGAVLSRTDQAHHSDISQEGGDVVARLYTPEEKAAFEKALLEKAATMTRSDRDSSLLPFAASSGLVELETKWRLDTMMAGGGLDGRFISLETDRARYRELAQELEQFAPRVPAASSAGLVQAATAWIEEGDVESQLRVMRVLVRRNALDGILLDRYLSLLATHHPDELVRLTTDAPSEDVRNRAVQWAIGSGNRQLAFRAVHSRGSQLKPVWTRAYTALTGVYLADTSPAVNAAFAGALDIRTVGERVSSPPSRDATLAGTVWFYYGARYGEYLDRQKSARAAAYLPATTENTPGSADAYLHLGDYYEQANQPARAIAQYQFVLQLDPDRGDAYDHIARVQWSQNRNAEAITSWRAAISAFQRVQSRGVRVPESFWERVSETFHDIGENHTVETLRNDMQHLLLDYITGNGSYRLDSLLMAAFSASLSSGVDTAWVLDLADKADQAESVIDALMQLPELTPAQRIALQRKDVAIVASTLTGLYGDARVSQEASLASARAVLISMLLDQGEVAEAKAEWNQLPEATRTGAMPDRQVVVGIRLAARTHELGALLERFRSKPETTPSDALLANAAQDLRREKEPAEALAVLEFLYSRAIASGRLDAANFLGLAEVRLEQKNDVAAVQLLHRMALVTDNPFDTFLTAADLLEKYGRLNDAAEFVGMRLKAVPWDADAKLHAARLAQGSRRHDLLLAVVTDPLAPYRDRAAAASLMAPDTTVPAPGTELALLATGRVTPAAAEQPFYAEARVRAAEAAPDQETRLRLFREALAIDPQDPRVRLGAVRAALALQHDSIAVSLVQTATNTPSGSNTPFLAAADLSVAERAALNEQLAAAAERLDDLTVAASYLRNAIDSLPEDQRAADEEKLKAINEEQARRAANAGRQPVIRNVVDQEHVVLPEIPGRPR